MAIDSYQNRDMLNRLAREQQSELLSVGTVLAGSCGEYFPALDGLAKTVAARGSLWIVVEAGITPAFAEFSTTAEMYDALRRYVVQPAVPAVSTADALAALQAEHTARQERVDRISRERLERREREERERAEREREREQLLIRRARASARREEEEREAREAQERAERLFGSGFAFPSNRPPTPPVPEPKPASPWQRADRKIVLGEDEQ
jgi:hypothetical protein